MNFLIDKNEIAVLICVYHKDRPEWFGEALNCLFNQTIGLTNIYLGVDGKISKELENVIDLHRSKFKYIRKSDVNVGLAKTLNNLINSLGNEKYVARMDADDACDLNRFECQANFLVHHPMVDILGTSILEIDENSKRIGKRHYFVNHSNIINHIYKGTPVGHPTVMVRRRVFDLLGGYNESVGMAEDLDLWFRAIDHRLVFSNIDEMLYRQRFHSANYSNRSFSKAKTEFLIYWKGCFKLFGISYRLAFPILRLLSRLLPSGLVALLYKGPIRKVIFSTRN